MFCTTNETFRDLLLKWRGQRTQRVIGELAGLSGKIISRFECGVLPKNEHYVIAIAEALGLTERQTARFLHAYTCNRMQRDGVPCCYCPYCIAANRTPPQPHAATNGRKEHAM